MAMRKLLSAMVIVFSMGMTGSVFAQDFEKGWRAYEAGNYATALKEFRYLAERGNMHAQWHLGQMYDNGQGVFIDYQEAAKWYRMAAEQGWAMAQYNLGYMLSKGQGVPQDTLYAHMWYNIAGRTGVGGGNREILEKRMTAAEISKAQELARECVKKNYKGC
jgi:TPR repeat protein